MELCFLSARELAERIRRKEISAREAVSAHLARIERQNPRINAFVTLTADRAMERAAELDEAAARGLFAGPLHGLPIAHKDLEDTKGVRTTYGSPVFRDHVPEQDSPMVGRVHAAGAIMLGKTNTPEFGAGSQTFNPLFGPTRNPWDLSKTCGGSSGGSAAALASGMVPLAGGSDMGGSLRNPASFCSVVGFRPSPGLVPKAPNSGVERGLSVIGPMARRVGDAALLLSAMALTPRFAGQLTWDFRGTRVAWCPEFAGLPFDRRVRAVFESRRAAFESLGCVVKEASPDFSGADEAFRVLRAISFFEERGALLDSHRAEMKDTVIEEIERGGRLTPEEVAEADQIRSALKGRLGEFMRDYDFLILPTVQVPPFDVEEPWVREIEGVRMQTYIDWMRSCYFISVTGHPAISVPAGFTEEHLPVGLQIVGGRAEDWPVLQLAHAFEEQPGTLPWPPDS